jgi:hypothetical protein
MLTTEISAGTYQPTFISGIAMKPYAKPTLEKRVVLHAITAQQPLPISTIKAPDPS